MRSRFFLHYADLADGSSLATLLHDIRPDEVYNLGAQSHVKVSFEIPEYTTDVVAGGTLRLLETIRSVRRELPVLPGIFQRDVWQRSRLRKARPRPFIPAALTLAQRFSASISP